MELLAFAAMGLALVRLLALPRRACTAPDPAGSIEGWPWAWRPSLCAFMISNGSTAFYVVAGVVMKLLRISSCTVLRTSMCG